MRKIAWMTILALTYSLLMAGSALSAGMTKGEEGVQQVTKEALFQGTISADKLVGMKVQNQDGKTIGEVSEQKTDETGQIRFLAVSTGGFLGIGEKDQLIPASAFKPTEGADALILTVDDKLLANAPEKSSDMQEEGFDHKLYEHYGQAPYWGNESEQAVPSEGIPEKGY